MPGLDSIEKPCPSSCHATRRTLRQRLALRYLLIALTGSSILLSTTGPLIERALALATDQQILGNNFFATTVLVAPDNLSASSQGHAIALNWSEGQSGTGYEVFGAENGNSSDCSEVSFVSLASTGDLSYLDLDRHAPEGTWFCYQVQTMRDAWRSQESNPVTSVQVGFVAASLQLINEGDASACGDEQYGGVDDLDCGDQIGVSFNQPVDTTTGPDSDDTVCVDQSSGTIWLGSTGSGDCTSNETVRLGRLTGGTIENGNSRFDARYDWNEEHTVLIVTVGALVSGTIYPAMSDSPWTLTPTANIGDLASDSGGYHICATNADGGNCLPAAAWRSGSSPRRDRLISEPTATPTPDIPVTITETPTSIETLDPTETLDPIETISPTDPAPTETPANDPFTPTPTPTATPTAEPTLEPPMATLEPTVEPPSATVEPSLEPLPTSTP
jgi:hypothetical protein